MRPRVLLVEPDLVLAKIYKQALESAAYAVSLAASAQAAISLADQQKPDLVLLELQLIEHSGLEFLYEFRSYPEWQSIPVIIHTQVPPSEFIGSWQLLKNELGVRNYLYKPQTTLKQLLASVKELSLEKV